MRKISIWLLCALIAIAPLAGCADAPAEPSGEGQTEREQSDRYVYVQIEMEDGGIIELQLDKQAAPITVDNFVTLVKDGFYDGLTFHRISAGFVIQGGDPDGNGTGGPGHYITGEFAANGIDNPILHERGAISMARSNAPDSAGSQFFIVLEDADFLDGNYAAFGHVVEGMDVVDQIAQVKKNGETPVDPPVMAQVQVVE